MLIVSIAAVALLVLGGCASQEALVGGGTAPIVVASTNANLTPKSTLHCHKESPAGSNMIHTVCETEQSESDRQALQNKLLDNGSQNRVNFRAPGP